MADFRTVHTEMWRADEWFQGLDTEARLFWIYLFTNPSASVAGIYRLPIRTMAFESGLSSERIQELLTMFARDGKAFYDSGVIWVRKMRDYQLPGKISQQLASHIKRELGKIPACILKNQYMEAYGYGTDTVSILRATDTDTDTDTHTDTDTETDTDTDTQPLPLSPAWEAFIKARGVNVNPNDPQYIGELEALYGSDAVAQAIYYCDTHKKNNYLAMSYISKMLSVWQGEGSLGLHPPGPNGNGNGKAEAPKKRKQLVYDADSNLVEVEVDV